MGDDEETSEAVTLEVELLSSVYGEDVSMGVGTSRAMVEVNIKCRPRTGGLSALAFISACLSLQLDKVAFPQRAPKVELRSTSGLGDDEVAQVVRGVEDWLDDHYPLGDEEETHSCLTLVEKVLDTLDSINQCQRCSICLSPMLASEEAKGVMATRTPCAHVFCFDCLSTWWVEHEEAARKRSFGTMGDMANAATESRKISLEDMRRRRLADLTAAEGRVKEVDWAIDATARELLDYQKSEEALGAWDKVGEQTLKAKLTSLKEDRKKARQELGPLRSRLYAVEQELKEVERTLAASGGPPPRAIPCPVCRLSLAYGDLPVEFQAMITTKEASPPHPPAPPASQGAHLSSSPQGMDDLPPDTLAYVRCLQRRIQALTEAREKKQALLAMEGEGVPAPGLEDGTHYGEGSLSSAVPVPEGAPRGQASHGRPYDGRGGHGRSRGGKKPSARGGVVSDSSATVSSGPAEEAPLEGQGQPREGGGRGTGRRRRHQGGRGGGREGVLGGRGAIEGRL